MKFSLENMMNDKLYGIKDDIVIGTGNGFLPYD
jgi:hypothetical protein